MIAGPCGREVVHPSAEVSKLHAGENGNTGIEEYLASSDSIRGRLDVYQAHPSTTINCWLDNIRSALSRMLVNIKNVDNIILSLAFFLLQLVMSTLLECGACGRGNVDTMTDTFANPNSSRTYSRR